MARKVKKEKRRGSHGANLGFEQKLWEVAGKLFTELQFDCPRQGVRLP